MSRVQAEESFAAERDLSFPHRGEAGGVLRATPDKFIPVEPKQDALFKEQQQSDPDAVFRDAIAGVCRTAQSNHIQPVLMFLPMLDDLQSTNQSRVLKAKQLAAAELNVPLCDVTRDVAPGAKALYLDADPVHFNAQGNEIIALRLFETVTNLVVRRTPQDFR